MFLCQLRLTPCVCCACVQDGKQVIYVYVAGYSVSIVSLLLALAIFTHFRQVSHASSIRHTLSGIE